MPRLKATSIVMPDESNWPGCKKDEIEGQRGKSFVGGKSHGTHAGNLSRGNKSKNRLSDPTCKRSPARSCSRTWSSTFSRLMIKLQLIASLLDIQRDRFVGDVFPAPRSVPPNTLHCLVSLQLCRRDAVTESGYAQHATTIGLNIAV